MRRSQCCIGCEMLDFFKINDFEKRQGRSLEDSKGRSFEDLVCLLVQNEKPEDDAKFQSIDGKGGDGGVDALWITSDKRKIGYQAKYIESLGRSQLSQMDNSITQAIDTHPELKKYVFAIPFDLTGSRGSKVTGRSQREVWDDKVKKWMALAAKKGIDLEFELWDATALNGKILKDENAGLLRYWFGKKLLNDRWFRSQVRSTVKNLSDHFNPEDHVNVAIETLFDTIVRGPFTQKRITDAFHQLDMARVPRIEFKTVENVPNRSTLRKVDETWNSLSQMAESFSQDLSSPWRAREAIMRLSALIDFARELHRQCLSVEQGTLKDADKRKLKIVIESLRNLFSACYNLETILGSPYIDAEEGRCSLVHGFAGAGKSHLLARVAEERVKLGLPTLLLLGKAYSDSPFWHRTGKLLGLSERTPEDILGLLNAVGRRKKQRVLILFDAINEGGRSHYWHSQISDIIDQLKRYSHVAMVFSCREEYLPYAIPDDLLKSLPKYFVSGFGSLEEREQAAIRYLDSKGIARPNTPWLEPEFSNPLFLKSTSEALADMGASEFPKGIRGISKLIGLYLDALSRRLEVTSARSESISNAIKRAVRKVANKMAENHSDFLDEPEANLLINECFSGRTPPTDKTWLQVLSDANLFRIDARPTPEDFNPLNPPPECVRFTFQRFQDYLMAETLTKKVRKGHEDKAFASEGPLSFLLTKGNSGMELRVEFAGLVGALSTIFPEKLGIEFVTKLPNREWIWKKQKLVREGFAESFKWRMSDTFSDQTRDLLYSLNVQKVVGLLLEVSMTMEHPYNARLLHENLKQWKLSERDKNWTYWINRMSRADHSQIDRIVSWALALQERPAKTEYLKLASVVLVWSLSSSHMTLRDRATKALTTVFLAKSSIFKFVVRLIHDCNDPYVIERLYAAAFGACCINQDSKRLSSYSSLIYDLVFADGKPPIGLLARDYALGVIELAKAKNALSSEVHLPNCYHPFLSDPPTFDLREEEVENIADCAGGKQIFMSAAGEWGDYGKYSIPGRVNFLNTPLREPRPLTEDELKEQFFEKVIKPFPERVAALNDLETLVEIGQSPQFQDTLSKSALGKAYRLLEGIQLDEKATQLADEHDERQKKARVNLKQYLSADEQKRLSSEYLREGKASKKDNRVSVDQCRLWVTKRAYELGWTADLFPDDGEGAGYIRGDNGLERIGKKYQRIALDELQARLADNFWLLHDESENPTVYRYSHHDYRRNIEPTILPNGTRYGDSCETEFNWAKQPEVSLPHVDGSDLIEWPFKEDPTASIKNKIFRTDQNGGKWLVLYEFSLDTQKHSDPRPAEHGTRYEEFRFIYCVLTQQGKSAELVKYLNKKRSLDVSSFQPREFTDGPYLLEAHWRDTWQDQKFSKRIWGMPENLEFAVPVADYHWESHLDGTLPNGFSRHLPQKWFADELGLKMIDRNVNSWINSEGHIVLTSVSGSDGRSTVVIDERTFRNYANQFNMEPVWVMIAERSAWPSGGNDSFNGRRAEAVAWYDGKTLRKRGWKRDTKKMMPSKV